MAPLLIKSLVINRNRPPFLPILIPSSNTMTKLLLSFDLYPLEHLYPPHESNGLLQLNRKPLIDHLLIRIAFANTMDQFEIVSPFHIVDILILNSIPFCFPQYVVYFCSLSLIEADHWDSQRDHSAANNY